MAETTKTLVPPEPAPPTLVAQSQAPALEQAPVRRMSRRCRGQSAYFEALQRAAGNRAVGRMMTQQRESTSQAEIAQTGTEQAESSLSVSQIDPAAPQPDTPSTAPASLTEQAPVEAEGDTPAGEDSTVTQTPEPGTEASAEPPQVEAVDEALAQSGVETEAVAEETGEAEAEVADGEQAETQAPAGGGRRQGREEATASPEVQAAGDLSGEFEATAIPPITIPTAPQLVRPGVVAVFDAPRDLLTAQLRAMTTAVATNPVQAQASVADVSRRFAGAHDTVQRRHSSILARGVRTISEITRHYGRLRAEVPAMLLQTDAAVGTAFQMALQRVNASAIIALAKIDAGYRAARRRVFGAAARARTAVRQNGETADTQISAVVGGLIEGRMQTISDVNDDVAQSAFFADDNIVTWRDNIDEIYPDSGTDLEPARHESYRAAAPDIATRARESVADRSHALSTDLAEASRQVQTNVRHAVEPTLSNHVARVRTEGRDGVERTFRGALDGVQQQADAARATVAEMLQSATQQLTARRQMVRTQLVNQAQQTLTAAHLQSQAAITTIHDALAQTSPRYADAVAQLQTTLQDAANGGVDTLEAVAGDAIPNVEASIGEAFAAQRDQFAMIVNGVQESVAQQRRRLDVQLIALQSDGVFALDEAAQLSSEGMQTTATSVVDGFATAADGINRIAATWSAPLAQVFANFITAVRNDLAASDPQFVSNLENYTRPYREWIAQYNDAQSFLARSLPPTFVPVRENLEQRVNDLVSGLDSWSLFDWTDEAAITRPLHGLTPARGKGMEFLWRKMEGGNILTALADELGDDSDDYHAARNYLAGNPAAGARYELRASLGWFNDDEARIESTMRALSPEQIGELEALDESPGSNVLDDVRDSLGGTDAEVFDALRDANYALADAHRMRDELDSARRRDDEDAVNTILTDYSSGRRADPYAYQPPDTSTDEHWQSVVQEFAGFRSVSAASTEEASAAEAVRDYVLRAIEVTRSAGEGETYTETLRVEGRQRDLATAIIMHGGQSIDARVARLGVETERRGGPDILNLDTALVDERLNPDYGGPNISPEARQAAREQALRDREIILTRYAQTYGGSEGEAELNTARTNLILELRERAGDGTRGDLAEALVREDYPTPATAAIALEYAQGGAGTREEVIWRFTERMNRDEIAKMRALYDAGGRDLYADLGVFGQGGFFTELSGDDRLRAERAMLGRPRNDRERAEVAAFTIHQQRDETGAVGEWWAEGSYSDRALDYQEEQLRELLGTEITFGPEGMPMPRDPDTFAENFDESGRYQGDPAEFAATMLGARLASSNYAAKVDQLSQAVTTSIAIAGAIAAGVVTVATGGAASPLLLAAIAGVTGVTAMAAQAAIRGGRYGWEQAAVDLGMTAVDALTAGVGQGLSLASRGGVQGLRAGMGLAREAGEEGVGLIAQMSIRNARRVAVQNVDDTVRLLGQMGRMTGSQFGDQLLVGAGTGALGSLGRTVLDENTYARGGEQAVDNLFASIFRGMASGVVTAGITNTFDFVAPNLGSSTRMWHRGLYQAGTNALGSFGGRYVELGIDAARGTYRGDAGDIFEASLQAAAQGLIQSGIEGAASARVQRDYNRFSRPHDERLQANQLRRQMADAVGDPVAMQQVLRQVAEASPGVRAFLMDPVEIGVAPRSVAEADVAETRPQQVAEPEVVGEAGARVRPSVVSEAEVVSPRPDIEAMPPGADIEIETPTVRPADVDTEDRLARRAVEQQEATGAAEMPVRAPDEAVMVPDADGNPVPAAALLPPDLRNRTPIVRDTSLPGNAVHVHREPNIHIRIGPEATAADIAQHAGTVRDMQRARGLIGLVRRAYDAVVGNPRPGSVAGEAYQELDKLPAIIEDRMDRMRRATNPAEQRRLQQELDSLYGQYRRHAEAAISGDESQGRGFVAMEDTTTQIRRLYDDQAAESTIRQIEGDLARVFQDADTQARVLARIIENADSSRAAMMTLVGDLRRLVIQMDSPIGQDADFQQLASRLAGDLVSRDPETQQGASLLLRYLSNNHQDILSGRKSAADLNELLDVFTPRDLTRLAGIHEGLSPTPLLETLHVLTRALNVSAEADLELRLRLIDLDETPTSGDVNAILRERGTIGREAQREQVIDLIDRLHTDGVDNPVGELARHIRRIRLQDPDAAITVQRIRESIDIERTIAELARQGPIDPIDLYQRLHTTEELPSDFGSESDVYQFFRNKVRASAAEVDQSFQANPLIEVLTGAARSEHAQDLLARWRALHQFVMASEITVNGEPFTRAQRRQMLGHVWEDMFLRTLMNSHGAPDQYRDGSLWSYHTLVLGANFDAVLITRSGNDVVVEVVDAKLSGAPFSENQQRAMPRLEALQTSSATDPLTMTQLREALSDNPGRGASVNDLLDQLVRDAFGGNLPGDVRFRIRVRRAESME